MEKIAKETLEETENSGKGSKTPIIWLIIMVVLFIAQGVGSYKLVSANYTEMATFIYGSPDDKRGFFEIKNLVVNPSGSGGERYLVVSIGVEISEPSLVSVLDDKGLMVKDRVILIVSSKTVDALQSLEGRNQLKQELGIMFNDILGKPVVRDLFFTQFVMQ